MDSVKCKCSGELKFIKIDGVTFINDIPCRDFHFICLKSGKIVIHSRFATLLGYITAQVRNVSA